MLPDPKYFIRAQTNWINDDSPLKIMEKSRQVGVTHATDYRTVSLVSAPGAHFDAFISTRDNVQAKLTLENCMHWAKFLHLGAVPGSPGNDRVQDITPIRCHGRTGSENDVFWSGNP